MHGKMVIAAVVALLLGSVHAGLAQGFDPNTDPSLVAWYAFDETGGTTAFDSGPSGLDGELIGDPEWGPGRIGGALDFDGDGDYVDCGTNEAFDITEQITMAFWFKVRAFDRGWNTVIAKGDNSWRSSRAGQNVYMEAAVSGSSGNYLYTTIPVDDEKWHHLAAVYDGAEFRVYIDGKLDATETSTGSITVSTYNVFIGENSQATGRFWNGWIDDVRIYDRALTEEEVKSFVPPVLKATEPNPADGALDVVTPLLRWTAGETAVFHKVYLGTSPELTEADVVAPMSPANLHFHVAGIVPGTMYYWRVDEIEADMTTIHEGPVWSFLAQPKTAYMPSPADGTTTAWPTTTLSWLAGTGAATHQLYFGEDPDLVAQGAAEVDKGVLEDPVFDPNGLMELATYYWRVDEKGLSDALEVGAVWSFTTVLVLEDFESYTDNIDDGEAVWQTWIDSLENPELGGSQVGYTDSANGTFNETTIVHGGGQSMPFDYNNVDSPFLSEAELPFAPAQDWTAGGVSMLVLHVRGASRNDEAPLYVTVHDSGNGQGRVVHPDAEIVKSRDWVEWGIPLSAFADAGVDLAAVEKMVIGAGDPENPVSGPTGLLYIDDIALAMAAPAQE